MDLLTIEMNNQKYTYLDCITLENKEYVAYMDQENVYVSECIKKEELLFQDVNDEIYKKVIKELHL